MDYKKELEELINIAIREGASDLHLSADREPLLRVSGFLIPLAKKAPLKGEDTLAFITAMLSKEELKNFIDEKEIDFSYNFKDVRFRGNGYFQKGNIGVALRVITKKIRTLAELGLPPVLETFANKQQGFFLVVGPVGHGKTTTLASIIDIINTERAEHIVTIEDPIEYVFEPKKSMIDQREVKIDTKDFQTALTNVFRQDVDVVMIGEMRGTETMATAVTAAETGHFILSTLHTNNAAQTIDRIIDSFPSGQQEQVRTQLASSLTGIFSQRLIPRISGGLIPAYELLISNNAVANLIREKRTHEIGNVIETGLEQGMVDMNRSLAELVRTGEITPEYAYTFSLNPKGLSKII